MKKTFASIALGLGVVALASAQGIVNFSNNGGTKISTNSVVGGAGTGLTDSSASSQPEFYFALFASSSQSSIAGNTSAIMGTNGTYAFNATGWSFAAYGTNTASAGRFASSTLDAAGNTQLPNGFAGGTSVNLVVIGWSANIGSTWSALQTYLNGPSTGGFVGESAMGTATPGTEGSTPAVAFFGTAAGNIPSFTLGLVTVTTPEPGTMALVALGGASMLLFRRKK